VRGGGLGQESRDLINPSHAHHQFMPDFETDGFQFTAQLMIPKTQHFDSF
jgi:hypothetical protein